VAVLAVYDSIIRKFPGITLVAAIRFFMEREYRTGISNENQDHRDVELLRTSAFCFELRILV